MEEALKKKDMDRYGAQYITLEWLREYHATTCKRLDMARIVSRDGKDFCLDCNECITNIQEHIETRHADPNQTWIIVGPKKDTCEKL